MEEFDEWQNLERLQDDANSGTPHRYLSVQEVAFEPLDARMGVWPPKTIPEALYEPLFGPYEPTEEEVSHYGDVASVPALKTYAVLDAAKMPYLLTGLLDASGLRYQSLFQGATQEDVHEHAPYLVELTEGSDLTCKLFTGAEGVHGLWEQKLGILLRSRAGFDDLRKHLRKFTRIQDEETGKWFFFRFWEQKYAAQYFSSLSTNFERSQRWFLCDGQHRTFICTPDPQKSQMVIIGPVHDLELGRANTPMRYAQPEKDLLREAKKQIFSEKLEKHLSENIPCFAEVGADRRQSLVGDLINRASVFGIRIEQGIADFALASLMFGRPLEGDPVMARHLQSGMHPIDKAKAVLEEATARKKGR